jgi:hypothetical protein
VAQPTPPVASAMAITAARSLTMTHPYPFPSVFVKTNDGRFLPAPIDISPSPAMPEVSIPEARFSRPKNL